jgi:coenzyme PQQ precursor peptide PqqA
LTILVPGLSLKAGCLQKEEDRMNWIKPEFKEVAVTLEVTAYAGRK